MTETSEYAVLLALLFEQYQEVEKVRAAVESGVSEKSALKAAYSVSNPTVNALIRCDVRNGLSFLRDKKKPEYIHINAKGGPKFRFPIESLSGDNKKKVNDKMNANVVNQMKDLRELNFVRSGWQAYRLHMVEVVSFELHARKKPNTLESILVGLIGKQEYGWWSNGPHKDGSYGQHQVSICKFLNLGIDAFWADYAKPFSESELKWTFPSYWSTRPTDADLPSKEQLLHAVELGKIRYELAMSKPLPEKWCRMYETPSDALLARFPDNILGGQQGYLSPYFWSDSPAGRTRFAGGENIVRFEWDRIGFGTQGKRHEYIARHPAGDRKERDHRTWWSVKLHIPTPQELFDWIQTGGTAKSYMQAQIDKIWE